MMDKGHRYTDKQIELLEKRLRRHYKKVNDEVQKKLTEYLETNEDYYNELWRRLDDGEITEAQFEYIVLADSGLNVLQNTLVEDYVESDSQAMAIVGAALGAVYIYNHNYQGRKMQSRVKKTAAGKNVVGLMKRLKRRRRLLPPPNPDKMKDSIWHRVKIRLVISDGLKRGRSIYDIAENLERVTNMDLRSAIRAARTACTNAENKAKLEAMITLRDEFGIDVKKMWYATLDNRTRTWHRELHGEVRELEEAFSNGLLYPGDPNGDPGEVWNCRCTLLEVINEEDIDIADAPRGKSRSEWLDQTPVSKPYPVPKGR